MGQPESPAVERELLLAIEAIAETFPLDVGHHIVKNPVCMPGIVERQDVRVSQLGRDLDLAEESLKAEDRGKLGPEDLEGHAALVLQVLGEIDRGHAAAPQLAAERVAVGEGRLEVR